MSDGLPDANVLHLEIDVVDSHRIQATTRNSLCYTESFSDLIDRCGRGTRSNIELPTVDGISASVNALEVDGAVLIAGTDRGVFRRTYRPDSGILEWIPAGLNEEVWPDVAVVRVGGGPDGNDLWAGTTRGRYRLRDGVVDLSLPPLLADSDDVISDVLVDPSCPSRIYVARGFQGEVRRHGGGVLVSEDGGRQWVSLTDGDAIDSVPVTDLDRDPGQPERLYVATFELSWASGGSSGRRCRPAAGSSSEVADRGRHSRRRRDRWLRRLPRRPEPL